MDFLWQLHPEVGLAYLRGKPNAFLDWRSGTRSSEPSEWPWGVHPYLSCLVGKAGLFISVISWTVRTMPGAHMRHYPVLVLNRWSRIGVFDAQDVGPHCILFPLFLRRDKSVTCRQLESKESPLPSQDGGTGGFYTKCTKSPFPHVLQVLYCRWNQGKAGTRATEVKIAAGRGS